MRFCRTPTPRSRRSTIPGFSVAGTGFTLIELLITIGIIAILVSLLIPTIATVRRAAQGANTRQMITRISAGLQAYYSDFGAYPGPFADNQLRPNTLVAPQVNGLNLTNTGGAANGAITETENMFLGLSGGLTTTFTTASSVTTLTVFAYDATVATQSLGPVSLTPNITLKKRYQTYMSFSADECTYGAPNYLNPSANPGEWNAGISGYTGDTNVPEFVDKYPQSMPIIYMRAVRGQTIMVGANGAGQYDMSGAYNTYSCQPNLNNTNVAATPSNYGYGKPWFVSGSGQDGVGGISSVSPFSSPESTYIGNASLSVIGNFVPQGKDTFVLISAGPDRIYGTKDDITSFR